VTSNLCSRNFGTDIIFASPTAFAVTGSPVVHGKDALREYWTKALSRSGSIQFSVIRVLWDAASRELAIIYVADIDGRSGTVSENLIFDDDGLVATAEVFHGVPTSIEP
jgi:steroid delta-isomerase